MTYILFDGGDDLEIPATMSIQPSLPSEVTSHPVEADADINDNVRLLPRELSLDIFASELDGQENFEEYDPDHVGPHITIRERLEKARTDKEPLHIDLGPDKGIYANMQILNLSPTWEPHQGKSLKMSIQLKEVNRAQTKTKKIPPKTAKDLPRADKKGINSIPKEIGEVRVEPTRGTRLDTQASSVLGLTDVPGVPDFARGLTA